MNSDDKTCSLVLKETLVLVLLLLAPLSVLCVLMEKYRPVSVEEPAASAAPAPWPTGGNVDPSGHIDPSGYIAVETKSDPWAAIEDLNKGMAALSAEIDMLLREPEIAKHITEKAYGMCPFCRSQKKPERWFPPCLIDGGCTYYECLHCRRAWTWDFEDGVRRLKVAR